jgi:hypothetical protein
MRTISKFLLPSIVGVSVYLVIHKLFPEKVKRDPLTAVRGGDDKIKLFTKIFRAIMTDRALKIGIIATFGTAALTFFQDEIITLLADDVFTSICVRDTDGNLKILCDIIEEYELKSHTTQMKEVILSTNLSHEHKVSLLKIKLDFIINGECGGETRFLIMALIGVILTFTISGVGGLSLILEALYRLFKEGKISKAVYDQIVKSLSKRWFSTAIPIEHLNS